ncbi:MAG: thiopurine S-methyltransferase [Halothiobacillaceae bacterium]|jgi:thiopurine S-methyltransferase|nr:thiopurine S-methyltransferase [Halothiobacillaceae bacterium]MDY0049296.1 thiopurine S-methyltransferase [Halothiobacillaceae bacterium]
MEHHYWHQRWQHGQIGFHLPGVNPLLERFWPILGLEAGSEVLVPLCGKSLDMLWLHRLGHAVLGVELSPIALDEFLQEHGLNGAPVQHDHYCGWDLPDMTLLCGDIFHLTAADCRDVRAVYDRAALIALPVEMRKRYVEHLFAILPAGARLLLISFEIGQDAHIGPPFSVPEAEIEQLFAPARSLQHLHTETAQRKGQPATEKVYLVAL